MRGEVAIAGRGERIDVAVGAQRLQRVAEAGDRVAVVDQQRRAALFDQPRAEFEHEADGRTGSLRASRRSPRSALI